MILYDYFKSIEDKEELENYSKQYILGLLKTNDLNYDLIELIMEILNKLLTKLDYKIFLNNNHVLENFSLSMSYTIHKNYKLTKWFPKLFTEYLSKEDTYKDNFFTPIVKVMTNQYFINNENYLKIIIKNKYFDKNMFKELMENKDVLLTFDSFNNYQCFLINLEKIEAKIKKKKK